MPNIHVRIPKGSFPKDSRQALLRKIHAAATSAEQIAPHPRAQFTCWVVIDEVEAGDWTCGGVDVTAQYLPCIATVHVPCGVLDEASRGRCVELMHAAFEDAMPIDDRRRLATSVVLHEVRDGDWGVGGALWRLPDFAEAAGYAHLQHLVRPAAGECP